MNKLHLNRSALAPRLIALVLTLTLALGLCPTFALAKEEESEDFTALGKISTYNVLANRRADYAGVLKVEGDTEELYITANIAAAMAGLLCTGNEQLGFTVTDGAFVYYGFDAGGNYFCQSTGERGTLHTLELDEQVYYRMEEILTALHFQFYEDGDMVVYMPPTQTILELLEQEYDSFDANNITYNEMALNSDDIWDRVWQGAINGVCYSVSQFSWKIFVPGVNSAYYEDTAATQALMQLAFSDENWYDGLSSPDSALNKMGEALSAIGDIVDGGATMVKAYPTAVSFLSDMGANHGLVNFLDNFDLTTELGAYDSQLKVAGYVGDIGALLSAIGSVNETVHQGDQWSAHYADQLRLLSKIDPKAYSDGADTIRSCASGLVRSYDSAALAGAATAAMQAIDFGGDKGLAAVPIAGPIYSICKAGVAVAKTFPSLKEVLDAYDLMYAGIFLVQTQYIARGEVQRLYQVCREHAAAGTITKTEIEELRAACLLWLRCQMRGGEMCAEIMKTLDGPDRDQLTFTLNLRMMNAADSITKLMRTEQADQQLYLKVNTASFTSDKVSSYRQELSRKVWKPGGSVNNATRFVYDGVYTYFWQTDASAYRWEGGLMAYYGDCSGTDSQLVRMDAEGKKDVLYTGRGSGVLGVAGNRIYYQDDSTICCYNTEDQTSVSICTGTINSADDDVGYLICTDGSHLFTINMETGETFTLRDGSINGTSLATGGNLFFVESDSYTSISLRLLSLDGTRDDTLATYTYQGMYNETPINSWMEINQLEIAGDALFFTVGATGGTGSIYAGGYLCRVDLATMEVTRVLGGSDYKENVGPFFRVADTDGDGNADAVFYEGHDPATSRDQPFRLDLATGTRTQQASGVYGTAGEITFDGLNICVFRELAEQQTTLVTASDYETFGVSRLNTINEHSLMLLDAQECGDFVYFTISHGIHQSANDLGWRYWMERESDIIYRKDLNTGETIVVHRF